MLVGSMMSSSGDVVQDHVVDRALDVAGVQPEPGRRVALRVEVEDQHPEAHLGQRRAEVHRGGGLADPALLVGDRDDAGAARAVRGPSPSPPHRQLLGVQDRALGRARVRRAASSSWWTRPLRVRRSLDLDLRLARTRGYPADRDYTIVVRDGLCRICGVARGSIVLGATSSSPSTESSAGPVSASCLPRRRGSGQPAASAASGCGGASAAPARPCGAASPGSVAGARSGLRSGSRHLRASMPAPRDAASRLPVRGRRAASHAVSRGTTRECPTRRHASRGLHVSRGTARGLAGSGPRGRSTWNAHQRGRFWGSGLRGHFSADGIGCALEDRRRLPPSVAGHRRRAPRPSCGPGLGRPCAGVRLGRLADSGGRPGAGGRRRRTRR